MSTLIDTHNHLDLPVFDTDRREVILRAQAAGIIGMVLVASAPANWELALSLAEGTPGMVVALGVHPNDSGLLDHAQLRRLRQLAAHPLVRAIGEIGLDYHWNSAPPALQQRVFLEQLELARELQLPVILHQREAEVSLLELLKASEPPFRGVMHCFTGGPDLAQEFLSLGFSLGIGGILTYRSARSLREAVQAIPLHSLLLETDAPYLAPVPYRGQRNEPAFLGATLDVLASLRQETPQELAEATTRNVIQLFNLWELTENGQKEVWSEKEHLANPEEGAAENPVTLRGEP